MQAPVAPTFTASGAMIPPCTLFSNAPGMTPRWSAQPPTLYHLRALRLPAFTWPEHAAAWFVAMLFEHSAKRRIKDDHKGLSLEAARSVVQAAYRVYRQECAEADVWLQEMPTDNDEMIRTVEAEMVRDRLVRTFVDYVVMGRQLHYFSNPHLTNNHPLIAISVVDPMTLNTEQRAELVEELRPILPELLVQISLALDVIDVRKKPDDRDPFIPLERRLTATQRVIYAVQDRA